MSPGFSDLQDLPMIWALKNHTHHLPSFWDRIPIYRMCTFAATGALNAQEQTTLTWPIKVVRWKKSYVPRSTNHVKAIATTPRHHNNNSKSNSNSNNNNNNNNNNNHNNNNNNNNSNNNNNNNNNNNTNIKNINNNTNIKNINNIINIININNDFE